MRLILIMSTPPGDLKLFNLAGALGGDCPTLIAIGKALTRTEVAVRSQAGNEAAYVAVRVGYVSRRRVMRGLFVFWE